MLQSPTPTPAQPSVRVERIYNAPPERVFDAWLDPTLVGRWMAPGPVAAAAEIEPLVGGRFRVVHSAAGRPVGGFDGTIVELDRPRLLVFAWGFIGPDGERGLIGADGERRARLDSRLTITFQPSPAGTRMVLLHEQLADLAAALPEIARQVEAGWQDVLDKLVGVVE